MPCRGLAAGRKGVILTNFASQSNPVKPSQTKKEFDGGLTVKPYRYDRDLEFRRPIWFLCDVGTSPRGRRLEHAGAHMLPGVEPLARQVRPEAERYNACKSALCREPSICSVEPPARHRRGETEQQISRPAKRAADTATIQLN